jgi:hypothetical protein
MDKIQAKIKDNKQLLAAKHAKEAEKLAAKHAKEAEKLEVRTAKKIKATEKLANPALQTETETRNKPKDILIRIGPDEGVFIHLSKKSYWIPNDTTRNINFIKTMKVGDRLWFVTGGSGGKIITVATYCSMNIREPGKIEDIMYNSTIELHYTYLYDLRNDNLLSGIQGQTSMRFYNHDDLNNTCAVNLPLKYKYLIQHNKIINCL